MAFISTKQLLGLALSAALVTVPLIDSASAATSAPPARSGVRLERACARVPNLITRTDKLISRLNGDAETRGSLSWLTVQIDKAEAAGRAQVVTVLENRLEVRTAQLGVLEHRLDSLNAIETICTEHGL